MVERRTDTRLPDNGAHASAAAPSRASSKPSFVQHSESIAAPQGVSGGNGFRRTSARWGKVGNKADTHDSPPPQPTHAPVIDDALDLPRIYARGERITPPSPAIDPSLDLRQPQPAPQSRRNVRPRMPIVTGAEPAEKVTPTPPPLPAMQTAKPAPKPAHPRGSARWNNKKGDAAPVAGTKSALETDDISAIIQSFRGPKDAAPVGTPFMDARGPAPKMPIPDGAPFREARKPAPAAAKPKTVRPKVPIRPEARIDAGAAKTRSPWGKRLLVGTSAIALLAIVGTFVVKSKFEGPRNTPAATIEEVDQTIYKRPEALPKFQDRVPQLPKNADVDRGESAKPSLTRRTPICRIFNGVPTEPDNPACAAFKPPEKRSQLNRAVPVEAEVAEVTPEVLPERAVITQGEGEARIITASLPKEREIITPAALDENIVTKPALVRPTHVAYKDALHASSIIPEGGIRVPDRKKRITYKQRLAWSEAVMKANGWTEQSVLAWHKDKAITVESYLRNYDNSQLPHPQFLKYLIPHLEKHGFQRMQMPDLTPYDRKYGLPVGLLNEIFKTETNGNCSLTSWARDNGAFGCIQLMIDTYLDAISKGAKGRDPTNLDEAIDIAATWINFYRKQLAGKLNPDHNSREYMDQLKAMYNSGPDGVRKALSGGNLVIANLEFCETQLYIDHSLRRVESRCLNPKNKRHAIEIKRRNTEGDPVVAANNSSSGFCFIFCSSAKDDTRKRGRKAQPEATGGILTFAPATSPKLSFQ
ncbi:MAG: hypothetical protein KGQ41_03965 [Alphaproteobacteria bacterium]|nr:hypothetical protein [Alphaproteobacteria bacterium]